MNIFEQFKAAGGVIVDASNEFGHCFRDVKFYQLNGWQCKTTTVLNDVKGTVTHLGIGGENQHEEAMKRLLAQPLYDVV